MLDHEMMTVMTMMTMMMMMMMMMMMIIIFIIINIITTHRRRHRCPGEQARPYSVPELNAHVPPTGFALAGQQDTHDCMHEPHH
jgi:biopolymer transport protein ExbB/TolQ